MDSVYYETPFCNLKLMQEDGKVCEIEFVQRIGSPGATSNALLNKVVAQIEQYIVLADYKFDLPIEPQGTEFQRKVWKALQRIPVGEVRTYGEIAAELQSSPRAVGNACRRNPIPVIIPCHRVVSAKGLGGFVGQTEGQKISIKQQLLAHEGVEI
jgi:methylated-DNA-[protein]-cysteine S-methyltransferase